MSCPDASTSTVSERLTVSRSVRYAKKETLAVPNPDTKAGVIECKQTVHIVNNTPEN